MLGFTFTDRSTASLSELMDVYVSPIYFSPKTNSSLYIISASCRKRSVAVGSVCAHVSRNVVSWVCLNTVKLGNQTSDWGAEMGSDSCSIGSI